MKNELCKQRVKTIGKLTEFSFEAFALVTSVSCLFNKNLPEKHVTAISTVLSKIAKLSPSIIESLADYYICPSSENHENQVIGKIEHDDA